MENRLKIRISNLFRSSFSSCKSKNITTDVFQQQQQNQPVYYLANHHQHRQLIEIFSPKLSPFVSVNVEEPESPESFQTHRISCSAINKHLFQRTKLCGGHLRIQEECLLGAQTKLSNMKGANDKDKRSKRTKKVRSRSTSFGFYEFPVCSYNGLFSSDEEDDDNTTFFSSRSLSSDTSDLLLRRSKDRHRRRMKTETRMKKHDKRGFSVKELPVGSGGFAVVKRSKDPYGDFMNSMVEMITEKQIFAAEDLEKLLQRFLSLNSYHHHKIIMKVFKDIWEALFTN